MAFVAGFLPYKPVAVVSNSMSPYFNRGDVCVIKKFSDYSQIRNLKEGDIIEYQLNNIFILHRIVDIKETTKGYRYQIKGDNNKEASNTSQVVLEKNYPIIENKIIQQQYSNKIDINEKINIDYQKYNGEVEKFKEQFNLPITAYLVINFNVQAGIQNQ